MQLPLYVLYIFYVICPICTNATEPKQLSFDLLQNSAELLSDCDGRVVEIRGFIYALPNSQWILAAEPNLKSCCLGHAQKTASQLTISWRDVPVISNDAVLVQGTFILNDMKSSHLTDASVIPKENVPYVILIIVGLALGIGIYIIYLMFYQPQRRS